MIAGTCHPTSLLTTEWAKYSDTWKNIFVVEKLNIEEG